MSEELYEIPLPELEKPKPKKLVANIFKGVWARVYLNIYSGDFTVDSGLTLKAALMEFFLPTTKRKQDWRHWLGAGSSEVSRPKAAFIIFLDIGLFFPRLAINVAKLVTEVLPDTLAQLFFLARRKAGEKYQKKRGLVAAGYWLASAVTLLFAGLFKFIYFIGCCITSPIATSIRARNFNYRSKTLSRMAFLFSHLAAPMMSSWCYFAIALLLINLIPGLGFVTTATVALFGTLAGIALTAYIVIDHLLSNFNRNPNGDELFEFHPLNKGADQLRYSDYVWREKKIKEMEQDIEEIHENSNQMSKEAVKISAKSLGAIFYPGGIEASGKEENGEKVSEEISRTLSYDRAVYEPVLTME